MLTQREISPFRRSRAVFVLFSLALMVSLQPLSQAPFQRHLASMAFPTEREVGDEDAILRAYQPYLRYVLEVGHETDAKNAKRLSDLYERLRRINPPGAARFLKGLRFEMNEKLELSGMSPQRAHSRNPEMRRWVHRFLREWIREADENLFRSIALRASLRSKEKR